jgi:hypothetical protein
MTTNKATTKDEEMKYVIVDMKVTTLEIASMVVEMKIVA